MAAIRVGDVGTRFQLTILPDAGLGAVDVSGAEVLHLIFRKPSGAVVTHIATMSDNGVNGTIEWTSTEVSDLDEPGPWLWQAYVELNDDTAFHTGLLSFDVYENLG